MTFAMGCFEVTIPGEDQPVDFEVDGPPVGIEPGHGGPDDPTVSRPDAGSGILQTVDSIGTGDTQGAPVLPDDCETHCDCPPGFDCINARCAEGLEPIQCCSHELCPSGEACWFIDGSPGTCAER